MYAVIKTGGKQYKVEAGATLKVEKLLGEVGSKVVIDKVLMNIDNADIIASVKEEVRSFMLQFPLYPELK